MNALLEKQDTMIPSEQDTQLAVAASRTLATVRDEDVLRVRVDDNREFVLPKAAQPLLAHMLSEMAAGNAVAIFPIHAELTTQEAADFLNVSRPHLIRLLGEKAISHHMVGTHRRIRLKELVAYKSRFEANREKAMSELAAQAQELGMGY